MNNSEHNLTALNGLYPSSAMPLGTYVRSQRLDKLGIIMDAFYADEDLDKTKIIIYTILILPERLGIGWADQRQPQYYVTNEYEYETIGYLMINPVDVSKVNVFLEGDM
jgi:hypothetical protein